MAYSSPSYLQILWFDNNNDDRTTKDANLEVASTLIGTSTDVIVLEENHHNLTLTHSLKS